MMMHCVQSGPIKGFLLVCFHWRFLVQFVQNRTSTHQTCFSISFNRDVRKIFITVPELSHHQVAVMRSESVVLSTHTHTSSHSAVNPSTPQISVELYFRSDPMFNSELVHKIKARNERSKAPRTLLRLYNPDPDPLRRGPRCCGDLELCCRLEL